MIYSALNYISDLLNENLKNEFSIPGNTKKVVLSNILNPDGTSVQNIDDKIVFFLIKLDEETTLKNNLNRSVDNVGGGFAQRKATINLNMHIIFCANFVAQQYGEGLQYLSAVIRFFQNNNGLDPKLSNKNSENNRLQFELCNLEFSELSHVWSAIGGKILPSVIYKVRLLTMNGTSVSKMIPSIKEPKKEL